MRDETVRETIARIALGVSLVLLVYFGPRSWGGLLAIVVATLGIFGFGPLPRLVGRVRAYRKKEAHSGAP